MPLQRTEWTFFNSRDYGAWYFWIDGLEYRASGYNTDAELIRAVIADPWYHHDYHSPRGHEPDAESQAIHGPYRVDAMSAEGFTPCSRSDALAKLNRWLEDNNSTPEVIHDFQLAIDRLIPVGQRLYELSDLGESAQHETGWIAGSNPGFIEFLAISEDRTKVRVLVAADD